MKNLLLVLMIALLGASCSRVPAGHVGIKVLLLGGEKGVNTVELGVGKYWIGVNEELFLFPTYQQNYVWTADDREGSENNESITFQTTEGLEVNGDIGISYSIDGTKASKIFQKYRKGVEEITDIHLRNIVRDAFVTIASTMKVTSVYGAGKTDMIKQVEKAVRSEVQEIGIIIEKIYMVGSFRLPPTVIAAINAKIGATQKAAQRENEVNQTIAEGVKKFESAKADAQAIMAIAKARADANRLLAKSITPSLVKYKYIEKWNGELSKVSGGANVLLNMDSLDK